MTVSLPKETVKELSKLRVASIIVNSRFEKKKTVQEIVDEIFKVLTDEFKYDIIEDKE
jgi:hypothetical protein